MAETIKKWKVKVVRVKVNSRLPLQDGHYSVLGKVGKKFNREGTWASEWRR